MTKLCYTIPFFSSIPPLVLLHNHGDLQGWRAEGDAGVEARVVGGNRSYRPKMAAHTPHPYTTHHAKQKQPLAANRQPTVIDRNKNIHQHQQQSPTNAKPCQWQHYLQTTNQQQEEASMLRALANRMRIWHHMQRKKQSLVH